MSGANSEIFFGRGFNFCHFLSVVFFFERFYFKQLSLSNKNDSRGVRGMLPRKIFENLHTAMAILVLFEEFFTKVRHIFGS